MKSNINIIEDSDYRIRISFPPEKLGEVLGKILMTFKPLGISLIEYMMRLWNEEAELRIYPTNDYLCIVIESYNIETQKKGSRHNKESNRNYRIL